jgi:hypothetical protein
MEILAFATLNDSQGKFKYINQPDATVLHV